VAQISGRPYTHAFQQTLGVPAWASDETARRRALSWLREQKEKRIQGEARLFWVTVWGTFAAIIGAIAAIVAAVEGWH
jgi:hypothetical protein